MGTLAVEGDMRDLVDELRHRAVTANAQPAVADGGVGADGERPEEEQAAGGLADVDETAGAGEPLRPKRLTFTLPGGRPRAIPRKAWSSPAAVVEVELVGPVDDRLRIGGRAEAQTAGGHAADGARLDGQRDQVQDPLLAGHGGDALGYPDPEIHDRVDLSAASRRGGRSPCARPAPSPPVAPTPPAPRPRTRGCSPRRTSACERRCCWRRRRRRRGCRGYGPRSAAAWRVVTRWTCTITIPPEFFVACAIESVLQRGASRSIVMLPSGRRSYRAGTPRRSGGAEEEELLALELDDLAPPPPSTPRSCDRPPSAGQRTCRARPE